MSHLQIHELLDDGYLWLRVTGELDIVSAPALTRRVEALRAEKRPVRLDLSGLDFMDTSGIHLLIDACDHARVDGWDFEVDSMVSPPVERLLEVTNLGFLVEGLSMNGL